MQDKINHHLKLFRFAKYVFVLIAIITSTVVLYYIIANQDNKISHNKSIIPEENNGRPNISLQANAPSLIGLSLDHGPYYIQAKEMQEVSGIVDFVNPQVRLMLKHLDLLKLVSDKASLITSNNYLQLIGNVRSNLNKLYYFEGEKAEIFSQESIIKSDQISKIYTTEYDLLSDNGFVLNYIDQTIFFHGKINANIKEEKNKSLTHIKSDKLDVFLQKKTGDFLGNVVLTKDGTIVEADKMSVIINPITNKLEKILSYGNIKIVDKNQTATGKYAEYIVSTSILTLKDKVKLIKDNNILTGELLHYDFNNHKADLVGSQGKDNARVKAIIIPKKQDK